MKKSRSRRTKHSWQIQQAQQRFSELVRQAIIEGPQLITRHGEACAWIISEKEYDKLPQHRESIVAFFERSPCLEIDLEIERKKDLSRGL